MDVDSCRCLHSVIQHPFRNLQIGDFLSSSAVSSSSFFSLFLMLRNVSFTRTPLPPLTISFQFIAEPDGGAQRKVTRHSWNDGHPMCTGARKRDQVPV